MQTAEAAAPAVVLEVMPEETKQLAKIVKDSSLSTETAATLNTSFASLFGDARRIIEQSRSIVVTDSSQKLQVGLARQYRLALKKLRGDSAKTKSILKEESLRYNKAVDGYYNIYLHMTETEENRLEEQEKFAERQEADRRAALKAERIELLRPYVPDTSVYMLDAMTPESFAQLLAGQKQVWESNQERLRREEADRIKRDADAAAERQKIVDENARLKREADVREEEVRKRLMQEEERKIEQRRIEAVRNAEIAKYGDPSMPGIGGLSEDSFQDYLTKSRVRHEERIAFEAGKKRIAALQVERVHALAKYKADANFMDLGQMSDEAFAALLQNSQDKHAAEQKRKDDEAALKLHYENLQKERADKLSAYKPDADFMDLGHMGGPAFDELMEKSRITYEEQVHQQVLAIEAQNKRKADEDAARQRHADALAEERRKAKELADEAAEQARIAREEKAKADAELARIQKAEQDRKDAEAKQKANEEAAAKLAAAAPDADKVRAYRVALSQIPLIVASTPEGIALAQKIATQTAKYLGWLDAEADKLAPKPSDDLGF